VNPMLRESYCERFSRPAREPDIIFKPEFLKKIYDLSDEALIRDVKVNMAFKYFLGTKYPAASCEVFLIPHKS